jgi:type VI secretion system secreted protein VgrG
MPTYVQADRPMTVTTPLGQDDLLLVGFQGREAISELFHFELDLIAENETPIAFEKLLGQKVTIHLALETGVRRHFSGICKRFSQGTRDDTFTAYRMEMVPQFWFLQKRIQSRIFQQVTVPEILKTVLAGLDVVYELQGNYPARDYCVQYRESDFQFASRLMEEEGIFYFFTHTASGHTMVVADSPQSHPPVPEQSTVFFGGSDQGVHGENRIQSWEKSQELRSGRYTLWDHSFELPHKHLEQAQTITASVPVGQVEHKLQVSNNDKLEIYDYPGAYAQRFDGVNPGGGDRSADLNHIFEDGPRMVAARMQEEAMPGLAITGTGTCRHFVTGHFFALERHFDGDGKYLLTGIEHRGNFALNYFRSGSESEAFVYRNAFTCIPFDLPFRPRRTTPRPFVHGAQTAVVVGPSGEEIFTDKYGRVKVQFHWDRQGKNDANSSCWIRVGTLWAGKQWGVIHIPRIGHEVIVDFLEGDPDQPLIVGSVYNADTMPPYDLPANKTQSGIRSRSSLGGSPANYNEIRFEDKTGSEELLIHAEKDQTIEVEHDESHSVGHDRTKDVKHDETTTIGHDRTETVSHDETITISHDRTETVSNNETITIDQGNRTVTLNMGNDSLTIQMGNQTTQIALGSSSTEAMQSIELKVGQSSIKLDQMGVTIQGMTISIQGQIQTQIQGTMTQVSGDALLTLKGGLTMIG